MGTVQCCPVCGKRVCECFDWMTEDVPILPHAADNPKCPRCLKDKCECLTADERFMYENPSKDQLRRACPTLQWRLCYDCRLVSLYGDCRSPAGDCHRCGSSDTRKLQKATDALLGVFR